MLRKLFVLCVVLMGSVALAQLRYPVDLEIKNTWLGVNEAYWSGNARTYIPIGPRILGSDSFIVPEFGITTEMRKPYGAVQLLVDGDYATLGIDITAQESGIQAGVVVRFCILSDKCGQ